MRTINWLAGITLLCFTFFSCSKKDLIEIKETNTQQEVELQQNIVIQFTEDIGSDSLLDVWISSPLVKFTPEVPGMFKWTAPNELTFSPTAKFAASTDYKAEVTSLILEHTTNKKLKLGENISFNFHTPYLNLLSAPNYWAKKESNKALNEVRFDLGFNYRINPSQLKELMEVTIDNKPVAFDVYTSSISETAQIGVSEGTTSFDDKNAVITIKPGLSCAESKYTTTQPISVESFVTSKGNFQILSVSGEYNEEKGYINVSTNQEVASEDIVSLVTLSPEIPFTIEKQASGFYVHAGFEPSSSYTITINKELKGLFGGTLKSEYSETVIFGVQKPAISFISKKGVYLSSTGNKNIAIRIINVPKVEVTVYKVYANNVISFFQNNNSGDYYDEEYYSDYGNEYYGLENIGDVVYTKEIDTKTLKKVNGTPLLNLNFNDINQFKGIYVVKVNSTQDQWLRDSKFVSISDIGLIAKQGKDDMLIFANSILGTEAISDVEINLISHNNQTVYTTKTDGEGIAHITDLKKKIKNFNIRMITATKGNDFNFLHFNKSFVENTDYETGGVRENETGYEAFVYGDREIYRPGETVYINTIVRDLEWLPLKQVPVKIRVVLPNGKDFQNLRGTLNEQGAFATQFKLPESTVTGTYTIEAYTSTNVLLNSKNISVEEFMPDRIKVNAFVSSTEISLNESLTASLQALNLFGPPASNRNYEVELSLKRRYFSASKFPDYDFGINTSDDNTFKNVVREGKTDAEGKGEEKFEFPLEYTNTGVLQGKVFTTVFDESGRPVHQVKSFDIFTQNTFYGIKYVDSYVSTGQPFSIPLVAVNRKGEAVMASARVEIVKYEWQTVLQKVYDSYRYASQKKVRVMEDKTISLSKPGQLFNFIPSQSGEYEIRVYAPGAATYVSTSFWAYGWGNTTSTSYEVNSEGKVTIECDKSDYNTGDEANVLFKTPFEGKLFVCIERNKVFEYKILETKDRAAKLNLSIKDEYLPNVYISATLIKPNVNQRIPLTVAHGYQNISVNKDENKIALKITAPELSRSRTKQKITVQTGKAESGVQVTIAVIDEGILQLKNTKTPDPYGFFYSKRALEVNSYDVYAQLLAEINTNSSSVGGDGYDLDKRVNPLSNKRVKLVTFWSGILTTDSKGEVSYEINIPQFSGDLRIMAVAYKDNHFGSAEKNMKVADPIVVSTSLPRFLSPGDSVNMPVTLTNTTSKAMSASVSITSTGPVSVEGGLNQQFTLDPNSEKQVSFKLYAKKQVGLASISTNIKANNEVFKEDLDITVRPVTSLVKVSGSGSVTGGNTASFDPKNDFIPSSVDAKLIVSRSPIAGFTKNLSYLIGYPYGCIEQTTSRVFPQLYIRDLMKDLQMVNYTKDSPENNVQEGIRRIYTMQTYSGGFSYWPGYYEPEWWGTAYATHFLIEAKKAGYDVQAAVIDKALAYLQKKVKEKGTYSYYYYGDTGPVKSRVIAAKEIFYSLYVLSLNNQQDLSVMNYYKTNTNILSVDSRYMLAATYLRIGDQQSYRTLLPKAFDGEKSVNCLDGSYYSYIRDMAITLDVLVENDPTNPQIVFLSKHLSEQLRDKTYLNTQETAFALIALGKLAKKNAESNVTADITSNGKSIGKYSSGIFMANKNISNTTLSILAKGTGILYYSWEVEGISENGKVKEEDSYLSVRRTFFDRSGNMITNNSFRQNDLIVVRIAVQSKDNSSVANVVLTDMLPAGFEIENPRLNEYDDLTWIKNKSTPDYFDIRDDRINFFVTASGTTKYYYYMVRAVSTGKFQMGPCSADAMYNGEYHSYNGAGAIRITAK